MYAPFPPPKDNSLGSGRQTPLGTKEHAGWTSTMLYDANLLYLQS